MRWECRRRNPPAERLAGVALAAGAAIAEPSASLTGQAKRREEKWLGLAVQGVLATAASAGEPRRSGSGRSQVARQVAGQMSRVEISRTNTTR